MSERAAADRIGELLGLDGGMAQTVRGDEVKFYVDGGKRYLSASDCRVLSDEFGRLAKLLDTGKVRK